MRETIDIDTSMNGKPKELPTPNQTKDPGLPIHVPLSWLRWFCYSVVFAVLLIPFLVNIWQLMCGALILGQFASQLNALIKK